MAFGASTTAVLALFTNQTFDRNYWVSGITQKQIMEIYAMPRINYESEF